MCGIVGYIDPNRAQGSPRLDALVTEMADTLRRRGPDGDGVWIDAPAGIGLGHRRLAVVDLSPTGAQPMVSASGRFVIVTNGEIYNHRALRGELERSGVRFRGTSDTEVLLEAIERWGLEATLRRTNGMFALAVWDCEQRQLSLARDRLGEKPLYFGQIGGALAFASRPVAFRRVPGFDPSLDTAAVGAYLRLGYVPHPASIFRQLRQVAPGEIIEARSRSGRLDVSARRWWNLDEVARPEAARQAGPDDGLDDLEARLGAAVALRLQADVPTGAFLSGGVDSSLVAALAQKVGSTTLRTFTVSVGTQALDESARASAVARHLGTDHTTIVLDDAEATAAVADVAEAYDEPFADPSAVPSLLLCREVRHHVTVALGGDGGDELFAGYNRHVVGAAAWRQAARIPGPLRRSAGWMLTNLPRGAVDRAGGLAAKLRHREAGPHLGDKVNKLGRLLRADPLAGPWAALAPVWAPALPWTLGPPPPDPVMPSEYVTPLDQLRWMDTTVTLPDDMLVKVDRASMHWALEARAPFLDLSVLEWAWSRPSSDLVAGRVGKQPLRTLLDRHVPPSLTSGPKRGFDPPLAEWLRGPLRGWAEERLAPDRLRATGWLDPDPIGIVWRQHLGGRVNHDYRLWTVLSLVGFLERWGTLP